MQVATTILGGSKCVSTSLVLTMFDALQKRHLCADKDDLPSIRRFTKEVAAQLQRRIPVPPTDTNSLLLRATALDPRHKEAKFLTEDIWASLKLALPLEQPQKDASKKKPFKQNLQKSPHQRKPSSTQAYGCSLARDRKWSAKQPTKLINITRSLQLTFHETH